MGRFLTSLESCGIDMVIFDVPPIRGLSDANILASKVDGTLVVVDISRARRKLLKQMKTQLSQVGSNVLGCVVNKERLSRHDSSYSYYYYRSEDHTGSTVSQNTLISAEQVNIPHSSGQPVNASMVNGVKRG
jgi:Mrp family chromosome partitioning ATPase